MHYKFAVGEVVLLQSVDFPECNGEATVTETAQSIEWGPVYKLDVHHNVDGWSDYWKESALRKKHQPGELSFTDLMASLSSPKLLTHQPQ